MKALVTLCCICCLAMPCFAADTVSLRDNKLTIHLVNSKLADALNTIQKKTGVEFVVANSLEKDPISIDLKQEDLEPAIDKLLKKYNKNFEYNKSGKITKVYVHSIKANPSPVGRAEVVDKKTKEVTDGLTIEKPGVAPKMEVLPTPKNGNIPGKVEKNVKKMEVLPSTGPAPGAGSGSAPPTKTP